MRTYLFKAFAACLLVGIFGIYRLDVAFANPAEQQIKVTGTDQAVNDLNLKFDGPVGSVRMKIGNQEVQPTTVGNDFVRWAQNTFGNVAPGGTVTILFDATDGKSKIDKKAVETFWTRDGNRIIDSVAMIGQQPTLFFAFNSSTQQLSAFVTYFNPEPFDVIYSNIQLYKNNNIANLNNLGQAFVPTGTLVTGLPTAVTLQAGQSFTQSFGVVEPLAYQLALADAAAASAPNDLFRVGAAAAVPEPASLVTLGLGTLGLLGSVWRRRKMAG